MAIRFRRGEMVCFVLTLPMVPPPLVVVKSHGLKMVSASDYNVIQ
jgi:hypothetical protein